MLELWVSTTPAGEHIYPRLWVKGAGRSSLEHNWSQSNVQLCSTPHEFDYWGDEAGELRYQNHSCAHVCRLGVVAGQCLHPEETYLREGTDEVFLATHIQETLLSKERPNASWSYFVPSVEGLGVSLQYAYAVPKPVTNPSAFFRAQWAAGSSDRNTATLLLDQRGNAWRQVPPGGAVTLTVGELLELAGERGQLDAPQAHLGPNRMPGAAVPDGPIGRLSGIALQVQLSCFNRRLFIDRDERTPMCYIKVAREASGWASIERTEPAGTQGELRHRRYHGIRVIVRTSGFFAFFSFRGVFYGTVAVVVLMQIPAKLVRFFAMVCLGRLSTVYKDLLLHGFSLRRQVRGLAARLLAAGSTYDALEKARGAGLPRHRVHRRLVRAISPHVPDGRCPERRDGMERFLSYSWHSMVDGRPDERSDQRESRASARGELGPPAPANETSAIDFSHFTASYSAVEPLALETLLTLFDPEMEPGPLERAFRPAEFELPQGLASKTLDAKEGSSLHYMDQSRKSIASSLYSDLSARASTVEDCTGEQTAAECEAGEGCGPRKPSGLIDPVVPSNGDDPISPMASDGQESRGSTLQHQMMGSIDAARLEQLTERMDTLEIFKGAFLSLEARFEQLEEDMARRLRSVESKVMDSLTRMDHRLGAFTEQASSETDDTPHSNKLAKLQRLSSSHQQELAKLHRKTELMEKSLAAAERALSFKAMEEAQGVRDSIMHAPACATPEVPRRASSKSSMQDTAAVLFPGCRQSVSGRQSGQQEHAGRSSRDGGLPRPSGDSLEAAGAPILASAFEGALSPSEKASWGTGRPGGGMFRKLQAGPTQQPPLDLAAVIDTLEADVPAPYREALELQTPRTAARQRFLMSSEHTSMRENTSLLEYPPVQPSNHASTATL